MADYTKHKQEHAIVEFDAKPSAQLVVQACVATGVPAILIGRLAVGAWLNGKRAGQHTKDLDVAVRHTDLPLLHAWLANNGFALRPLPIGGIQASQRASDICVDFIDRSSEEWGDLSGLVAEAIDVAQVNGDEARIGESRLLLCPLVHLVVLKFISGRQKDEDDVRDLLRHKVADVEPIRQLFRRHHHGLMMSRFEDLLQRMGHPQAKQYDDSDAF